MNVLLIVDIQKSMGVWFPGSYLNKVEKFLRTSREKYDAVYMIMEPAFTYSGAYKDAVYTTHADEVPTFILNQLTLPPFYKVYDYDYWKQEKKEGRTDDQHFLTYPTQSIVGSYTLYLNTELRQLLDLLKSATSIEIIGGGLTKCVELTQKLLTLHSIPHQVLEKLCYEIRFVNTNRRDENTFIAEPIKSLSPRILNADGLISMAQQQLVMTP